MINPETPRRDISFVNSDNEPNVKSSHLDSNHKYKEVCKKFHKHGIDKRFGCTLNKNCSKFHPKVCFSSLFKKFCFKESCKFHHIKGTLRKEFTADTPIYPLSPHTVTLTKSSHDSLNQHSASVLQRKAEESKKKNCLRPETVDETQMPKFAYINIQGLIKGENNKRKITNLSEKCQEEKIKLLVTTESHLNSDILNEEIKIPDFEVYRSDRRAPRKCGGVAVFTHQSMKIRESKIKRFSNSTCELLILEVEDLNLHIVTIYRPPDTTCDKFQPCLSEVEQYLKQISSSGNIMLLGDFNFPFLKWKEVEDSVIYSIVSGSTKDEQNQAQALLNIADYFFLSQVITEPTRLENTIDLVFTNNPDLLTNINIQKVSKHLSDHNEIIANLNWTIPEVPSEKFAKHTSTLASLNFWSEKADWIGMNSYLSGINWSQRITSETDVTTDIHFLSDELSKASENFIPKKRSKLCHQIPRDRKILMRRNKFLKRKLLTQHKDKKVDKIQNEMIEIQTKLLKSHEAERLTNEVKVTKGIKNNSKLFYSYAKRFLKKQQKIGPLKDKFGNMESDPLKMSEIIKEQYEKSFSKKKNHIEVSLSKPTSNTTININDLFSDNDPFTHIDITKEDVVSAIKATKINSAPGPDGVPPILLHNCIDSIVNPLHQILKKSFENSDIPEIWKEAFITPIYKNKGDKSDSSQYRPISLTSQIVKLLERIIRIYLIQYLEVNHAFPDSQHGFRPGRSTVTQLVEQYENILNALTKKHNMDIIMLDYAKAFDTINHSILLHKLKNLGISGTVGKWIANFLLNRNQRVAVNGFQSNPSKVISGVPQGTILGPVLFLVYIADIADNITHSTVSSYADDSKVSKEIKSEVDGKELQKDTNILYRWSDNNLMQFNSTKFEVLRIGSNNDLKQNIKYTNPEGDEIPETDLVKDLGVHFNSRGDFSDHIKLKVSKAKQIAGYIMRTFLSRKPEIMLTLLKSLVLPIIDYSSVIWNPHTQQDIAFIESVQRNYTSKLDGMADMNYYSRLKSLNLYSSERRRDRYQILYIFKIIHGRVPNPGISFKWSQRRGKVITYPSVSSQSSKAATLLHHSFTRRAPRLFNALPQSLRNIPAHTSADLLKSKVDKFLQSIPDEPRISGHFPTNSASSNRVEDQILLMGMERLYEDHH